MTLDDYCDAINAELVVRRYPNQNNRWVASFKNCEVKSKGCLESTYGTGNTPANAIEDYLILIWKKTIVFDAMSTGRREFVVPSVTFIGSTHD